MTWIVASAQDDDVRGEILYVHCLFCHNYILVRRFASLFFGRKDIYFWDNMQEKQVFLIIIYIIYVRARRNFIVKNLH